MLEIGTNENGVEEEDFEKEEVKKSRWKIDGEIRYQFVRDSSKFLLEQLFVNIRMLQRIVF